MSLHARAIGAKCPLMQRDGVEKSSRLIDFG